MKERGRTVVLVAAIGTAVDHDFERPCKASSSSRPHQGQSLFGQRIVQGEVIVRFERGASSSDRAAVKADVGGILERELLLPRAQLVRVAPGTEREVVAKLERDPNVGYAEPNRVVHADATPNDTRFTDLWGLNNTGQTVNGAAGTADADIDGPRAGIWARASEPRCAWPSWTAGSPAPTPTSRPTCSSTPARAGAARRPTASTTTATARSTTSVAGTSSTTTTTRPTTTGTARTWPERSRPAPTTTSASRALRASRPPPATGLGPRSWPSRCSTKKARAPSPTSPTGSSMRGR